MTDINIEVGLVTKQAKDNADDYVKSLDSIIERGEAIEKSKQSTAKAMKEEANAAKDVDKSLTGLLRKYDRQEQSLKDLDRDHKLLTKALVDKKIGFDQYSRALIEINNQQEKYDGTLKKIKAAEEMSAKAAKELAASKAQTQKANDERIKKEQASLSNRDKLLRQFRENEIADNERIADANRSLDQLMEEIHQREIKRQQVRARLSQRVNRQREVQAQKAFEEATIKSEKAVRNKNKELQRLLNTYAPVSQATTKLDSDLAKLNERFRGAARQSRAYQEALDNINRRRTSLQGGGTSGGQASQAGMFGAAGAAGVLALSNAFGTLGKRISPIPSLIHLAAMALSVFTAVRIVRSIFDVVMQIDSLTASLIVLAGSAEGGAKSFEFLRGEADRLGVSILDIADGYKQFQAAANAANIASETTIAMFSAITEGARSLKLSADDTKGTIRALQQMISKGKVQAEELRRQLGDRFPGAVALFAAGIGKSTAEVDKLMDEGKLIADELLPAFLAEVQRTFPATEESLDALVANLQRTKNSFIELSMAAGEAGFEEAASNLFKAMTEFAQSDTAMRIAQGFGEMSLTVVNSLLGIGDAMDRLTIRSDTLAGHLTGSVVEGLSATTEVVATIVGWLLKLPEASRSFGKEMDDLLGLDRGSSIFKMEELSEVDLALRSLQNTIDDDRGFRTLPKTVEDIRLEYSFLADEIARVGTANKGEVDLFILQVSQLEAAVSRKLSSVKRQYSELPDSLKESSKEAENARHEIMSLEAQLLSLGMKREEIRVEQLRLIDASFLRQEVDTVITSLDRMVRAMRDSEENLQLDIARLLDDDSIIEMDQRIRLQGKFNEFLKDTETLRRREVSLIEMQTTGIRRGLDAEEALLRAKLAVGIMTEDQFKLEIDLLKKRQEASTQQELSTQVQQLADSNRELETAINLFDKFGDAEQTLAFVSALYKQQGDDLTGLADETARLIKRQQELKQAWEDLTKVDPFVDQIDKLKEQVAVSKLATEVYSDFGDSAVALAFAQAMVNGASEDQAIIIANLTEELQKYNEELNKLGDNAAETALKDFNEQLENQLFQLGFLSEGLARYNDAQMAEAFAQAMVLTAHIENATERERQIDLIMQQQLAIQGLTDSFNFWTEALERPTGLEKIADELERISATDPFANMLKSAGSMARQMSDIAKRTEEIRKQQANLNRENLTADQIKQKELALTTMLIDLEAERTSAALSGTASMVDAISGMFKEESKERKAALAISRTINAIEVGLAMQKAASYAIASIAAAGNAPPPASFGFVSAMAGIMAGIGAFAGSVPSGGGGSGSTSQRPLVGSGTVFGAPDVASESISKSLENIRSLSDFQLVELKKMTNQLERLNDHIVSAARNIFTQLTGGLSGQGFDPTSGVSASRVDEIGRKTTDFIIDSVILSLGKGVPSNVLSAGLGSALGSSIMGPIGAVFGGLLGSDSNFVDKALSGIGKSLFGSGKVKVRSQGIELEAQRFGQAMIEGIQGNLFARVRIDRGSLRSDSKKTIREDLEDGALAPITEFFSDLSDGIISSLEFLRIDPTNLIDDFVLFEGIGRIDWTGNLEEDQKILMNLLSQQSDLMVNHLVPSLEKYADANEGLTETLFRVTQEAIVADALLSDIGFSLESIAQAGNLADNLLDVSQAVIDASGGFDEFIRKTQRFAEVFLTPVEQVEKMIRRSRSILTDSLFELADLGFDLDRSMIESPEGFREFVEEAKKLGTDPAQMAAILNTSDALADYWDTLESGIEILNKADKGFERAFDRIQKFLDSVLLSNMSPLTNLERYLEAKEQYETGLALAKTGDLQALEDISSKAGNFLNEAKDYLARSSDEFVSIFKDVTSSLQDLLDSSDRSIPTKDVIDSLVNKVIEEERESGLDPFFDSFRLDQLIESDSRNTQEIVNQLESSNEVAKENLEASMLVAEMVHKLSVEMNSNLSTQTDSIEDGNRVNGEVREILSEMVDVLRGRSGGAVFRSNSGSLGSI